MLAVMRSPQTTGNRHLIGRFALVEIRFIESIPSWAQSAAYSGALKTGTVADGGFPRPAASLCESAQSFVRAAEHSKSPRELDPRSVPADQALGANPGALPLGRQSSSLYIQQILGIA